MGFSSLLKLMKEAFLSGSLDETLPIIAMLGMFTLAGVILVASRRM